MIPLPTSEGSSNVRALARLEREDFTGIAAATLTLFQNPVESHTFVFKNGALLHNIAAADYTIAGTTITFAVALIVGDKVTVLYYARAN